MYSKELRRPNTWSIYGINYFWSSDGLFMSEAESLRKVRQPLQQEAVFPVFKSFQKQPNATISRNK